MKRLFVTIVLLCSFMGITYAWESASSTPLYRDVQHYDFDLSVTQEGNALFAEWNAFAEGKDFKWYKFVYSETEENPVYPDHTSHYVWDNRLKTSEKIWLKRGKTYYVRLCAVTDSGTSKGRYCSKVHKVKLGEEYKEVKTYVKDKKEEVKKEATTVKKATTSVSSGLSTSLKARIDTALEAFIGKLEARGYSDEKMAATIDSVIDRLSIIKKSAKYTLMAGYMIEVLEEYKSEYQDDFGDLEDLLNGF